MRYVLYGISLALILVLVAAAISHLRPKITRIELGITMGDTVRCEAPKLPTYKRKGNYDRRLAAYDYLPYAVATLNVYGRHRGLRKGFTLAQHSPEWIRIRRLNPKRGLTVDIHHMSQPDRLTVLTVFRGTDSGDRSDFLANLSWLASWLPIETQYDQARRVFMTEVRAKAFAKANGRKVSFIAAGHSLGGGLAQHMAFAFPCVGAVVFNSSFVTNKFRLKRPYRKSQIIHIFENQDELTRIRRLLFVDRETKYYKHYRQNAVNDRREFQHTMTGLAIGMARQVLRCQLKRKSCKVPRDDPRIHKLFCGSIGKGRKLCRTNGA